MDKLDLLGVKYDAEMEQKAKYKLAKNLYEFWKEKCEKFKDFKNNCLISICYDLRTNDIKEISEIWEMIEEKFFEDLQFNSKDIYEENRVIIKEANGNYVYDSSFIEIFENEYYTVIDKQLLGYKIGKEIKEAEYIEANGFIDEILTKIEEEYTYKIRNEICDYVMEEIGIDYDEI